MKGSRHLCSLVATYLTFLPRSFKFQVQIGPLEPREFAHSFSLINITFDHISKNAGKLGGGGELSTLFAVFSETEINEHLFPCVLLRLNFSSPLLCGETPLPFWVKFLLQNLFNFFYTSDLSHTSLACMSVCRAVGSGSPLWCSINCIERHFCWWMGKKAQLLNSLSIWIWSWWVIHRKWIDFPFLPFLFIRVNGCFNAA